MYPELKENRPHGEIYVAFVPDEEVGLCGSKKMDFSKFPVEFAYTIDCCDCLLYTSPSPRD